MLRLEAPFKGVGKIEWSLPFPHLSLLLEQSQSVWWVGKCLDQVGKRGDSLAWELGVSRIQVGPISLKGQPRAQAPYHHPQTLSPGLG